MDTPDLLIPIRLSKDGARADLQAFVGEMRQGAKQAADAQTKAQQDAEKERLKAVKQAAADVVRANREANALLTGLARDEAKAARDAARAKAAAEKEAWNEAAKAAREATAVEKMMAAEEAKAVKESARQRAVANREVNTLLKEFSRDEAREAKRAADAEARAATDAARVKARADREAFQSWKAAWDARHRQTMAAWDAEQKAVKQSGGEISNLIKTGLGLSAVSRVAGAIGDEFRKASEYVAATAQKFADVRTALQQVAALRGQKNTNEFTIEQVQKAAKAGLTPQEWVRAQEGFLNPAGAQVGDQPGAKMTDAQAEDYQMRVARLAKSKGIDPALAMEFAGSILEQSKGPLTVEQAMGQFNPAFETLQKGRIDLRRAMPMMSQVMSHGVSAQQAATLMSVVAPAAPGEEATASEAAMRAIEEMRVGGKGAAFGVTDKMDQYEAIKAFSRNIAEREQALRNRGKNDNEIEVEIARQLKESDVASDIRERRGLVRGMARQGITLGGFERFEAAGNKTAADADIAAVREYEASDEGKAARRRANFAAAEAKAGRRGDPIAALRMEAETALTNQGRFEQVPGVDKALGSIPFFADDTHNQQINRQAIFMARRQLGEQFNHGDMLTSLNRGSTDELLRTLIQRIEEQNKMVADQGKMMADDARRNNQPRPLPTAPRPPMPAGR